ncbi:SAM-dependent methyltransferase [Nocardia salmonicida]|uniref:SAM-dependent methyltransferase n=1 Tax=Nocardia salmonicida TaxID=53431 RepID=UPI0035A24011
MPIPTAWLDCCRVYADRGIAVRPRTREEVGRFFDGLELVSPGVEVIHRWRNAGIEPPVSMDKKISLYGAVGRKV